MKTVGLSFGFTFPPIAALSALAAFTALLTGTACAQYSVQIDIGEQKAYLLYDDRAIMESPISSGRYGHLTPNGTYTITDKDLNHTSSIYGRIEDEYGRTVVSDADVDMPVGYGTRFVNAPMRYYMHRCVTTCSSLQGSACTPVICRDIQHHMVVSGCRKAKRSRFSKPSRSELRLPYSGPLRATASIRSVIRDGNLGRRIRAKCSSNSDGLGGASLDSKVEFLHCSQLQYPSDSRPKVQETSYRPNHTVPYGTGRLFGRSRQ